jgi:hypothetical protein
MEEREALQVVTFVMRKPQAELVERTIDALEKEMGGPNPRGRALEHVVKAYLEATGQKIPETSEVEPVVRQ